MTRGPEAPRGARKRTQKTLNYEAEQQSRWFQRAVELNLAPLAAVAHDVIVRGVATNPALLRAARYADAQWQHFRRLAARTPAATAAHPEASAEDGGAPWLTRTSRGARLATRGPQQANRPSTGQQPAPGRRPTTSRGQSTLEVPRSPPGARNQLPTTQGAKTPEHSSSGQPGAPTSYRAAAAAPSSPGHATERPAAPANMQAQNITALLAEAAMAAKRDHVAAGDSPRPSQKAALEAAAAVAEKELKTRAVAAERKCAQAEARVREMQQALAADRDQSKSALLAKDKELAKVRHAADEYKNSTFKLSAQVDELSAAVKALQSELATLKATHKTLTPCRSAAAASPGRPTPARSGVAKTRTARKIIGDADAKAAPPMETTKAGRAAASKECTASPGGRCYSPGGSSLF